MSKVKNAEKARPREIERKFLVAAEPPAALHLARRRAHAVAQGYLAADAEREVEVRVRRLDRRCFLTVKQGGGGRQRVEVEVRLSQAEFDALWPATEGRRITKRRYRLPNKGTGAETIELDIYEAGLAGLRVAEVEFPSEAAARAFRPPEWFGREVTDDPAYRNAALARHGRPSAAAAAEGDDGGG